MVKKILYVIVLVLIAFSLWYWFLKPVDNISQGCIDQCDSLGQVASMETDRCSCAPKE